jgi:site-specific DNA-methyltransferase (adenine-specific)
MLDEQSGELTSGSRAEGDFGMMGFNGNGTKPMPGIAGDSGGASRFFYTAKASRGDRDDGLDGERVTTDDGRAKPIDNPYLRGKTQRHNSHPTVKPTDLMRWLCKLITPPNGLILDPFCGSGSTGVAAVAEGFRFIGIEQDAEYVAIAERRIANVAPLFGEVAL